jgi:hypothetical protein
MAASSATEQVIESAQSSQYYEVEKRYYDYAENIEAVNIHYACSLLDKLPDWNSQRATLFLPLVESHLRRKVLKLPRRILDQDRGELTDRYLLHHCFEIFADGDTHYSALYTEEVVTGAGTIPAPRDAALISEETVFGSDDRTTSSANASTRETGPLGGATTAARSRSKAK